MKELPENQLDPRVKMVWRINDVIWVVLLGACVLAPFLIFALIEPDADWAWTAVTVVAGLWALCLFLFLVVLPPIQFMRWRYQLSDDYLDIARGIIWRKRFIIPFIRVQNTDTTQGPIQRAFGLASVTVSTAAGKHEIPGLSVEVAEQLRDKAAELARIAQEDV